MPTDVLDAFPKASVALGDFTHEDYTKINRRLKQLDKYTNAVHTALGKAAEFTPKLASAVGGNIAAKVALAGTPILASSVPIAGVIATVISILVLVVTDAEDFLKKLQHLEQKIYCKILEGKLKALKNNLENIRDSNTPQGQRRAEIVNAVSHLHEVLPYFTGDSILREKYHLGAPLFVDFCIILKWIAVIAESKMMENEYNASSLQSLKNEYQQELTWYSSQCIGRRLASCYVKSDWFKLKTEDYDWLASTKSKYYGGKKEKDIKWADYKTDLGGKGWLCQHGDTKYYIVDEWDRRSQLAIECENVQVAGSRYADDAKNLLETYRNRVEATMLEYFTHASLEEHMEQKHDAVESVHSRNLPPHHIQSPISWTDAISMIGKISHPLAEIIRNIQRNKVMLFDMQLAIEGTKEDINELRRMQMTKLTELDITILDYPKTVCTNRDCVKIWAVEGQRCTVYNTICHGHCSCLGGYFDYATGGRGMSLCIAMSGKYICKLCGHSFREHRHIDYDFVPVARQSEDQSLKESLEKNLNATQMRKKMIDGKKLLIREYGNELTQIIKALAVFQQFTNDVTRLGWNYNMSDYLDDLIREEGFIAAAGGDKKTLDYMEQSKKSYLSEMAIIGKQSAEDRRHTPFEVGTLIENLMKLKHSGPALKNIR